MKIIFNFFRLSQFVLQNTPTASLYRSKTASTLRMSCAWPDFIKVNKKYNLENCRLRCPGWPLHKIERKWKERQIQWPWKRVDHENDVYTNCNWCPWYCNRRIIKESGGLGNMRMSGDYPNYHIIEKGQNTKRIPGSLRRLAVTQTSEKDHQFTLMWKIVKE